MASTVSAVVLLTWFYVMFLFLSFWLLPLACETLVPRPGIELLSPALKGGVFFFFLKGGVLTTGLTGKSLTWF